MQARVYHAVGPFVIKRGRSTRRIPDKRVYETNSIQIQVIFKVTSRIKLIRLKPTGNESDRPKIFFKINSTL